MAVNRRRRIGVWRGEGGIGPRDRIRFGRFPFGLVCLRTLPHPSALEMALRDNKVTNSLDVVDRAQLVNRPLRKIRSCSPEKKILGYVPLKKCMVLTKMPLSTPTVRIHPYRVCLLHEWLPIARRFRVWWGPLLWINDMTFGNERSTHPD